MTMAMTVSYSGGVSNLQAFNVQAALSKWASFAGPEGRAALKSKCPVDAAGGPGAGRMRDSITSTSDTFTGGMTITYTANVPYAKYVINGTAPHDIYPKAARALHWGGASGPFASVVHHPGTRPNDFVERALVPLEPILQEELSLLIQEALTE